MSLFSMHDLGVRINGGIGFAISAPQLLIACEVDEGVSVIDARDNGLSDASHQELINTLCKVSATYSLENGISIRISGGNANYGFGSGTAIRLASIEALLKINGLQCSEKDLVALSSRGGTSGVGVNTYFSGGMIIDLGVKNNNTKHTPSSEVKQVKQPLVLKQHDMPEWDIGICVPNNIKPLSKQQEIEFFSETCPISKSGAYEALYHSLMGVFAAVCEKDKNSFERGIRELQVCEWKQAERNIYGVALAELERGLYQLGATSVGMSSLGPSLYFLSENIDELIVRARDSFPSCTIFATKPCNKGRLIQCSS